MECRMFFSASSTIAALPDVHLPAVTAVLRAVTAPAASVTWSSSAPRAPIPRAEPGVVQVGSKLYVLGGYAPSNPGFLPVTHRCDVLDFTTGKYTRIADLPAGAAVNHAGVASDGKFIYLIAGQIESGYGHGTRASFRYDIAANKWSRFVDLPFIRFGGAAVIVNNVLHYFGGDTADRTTVTTDHWALDLAHPEAGWKRKASLPKGGDHLGHAVIDGIIYAIGGEHGHHVVGHNSATAPYIQHKYVFTYNPASANEHKAVTIWRIIGSLREFPHLRTGGLRSPSPCQTTPSPGASPAVASSHS